MNPLMLLMSGLGGLGGLLGGKNRGTIDPTMLAHLFGPNALAGDTQTLYNTLASSPMFQAMMNSTSAMGARAGQNVRAGLARAGIGASGIGAISGAVSRDFGTTLGLNARSNLWQQAMQSAGQNLNARMNLFGSSALQQQGTPTMAQSFGNALTGGAATGLNALLMRNKTTSTNSAPMPSTAVISAPMRRIGQEMPSPYMPKEF